MLTLRTRPRIQRQPQVGSATPEPVAAASPESALDAAPEPTSTEAPASPSAGLIVEDDATELQPGQLRKSAFLDELHSVVCAAAEAALAGTDQSTDGCPYLSYWFEHYRNQSSAHVENALRRYAPEARAVHSASEYIPLVAARVRQGVSRWATTGDLTDVPEGVPLTLPGGAGGLASGLAGLFFKARDGGARADDDPIAVQRSLGAGRPLDAGIRSRMEQAFGRSFAHVRTHTDAAATRLSSRQNARAFTVGRDVAFGAGEYRPGTMVGDALIAHELAHVVQQDGASATTQAAPISGTSYSALERDADDAAVAAVASLWRGPMDSLAGIAGRAGPALRSGLRLSSCKRDAAPVSSKTATINVTVLNGATDRSAADIRTSNRIFSGSDCNLSVAAGTTETLDDTATEAILGDDDLLEEPAGATVSTEEEQLVTHNRTSGRLTAYYVPGFNPSKRGTSLQAPRHGVADSLLMGRSAASDTFTHELCHILGRDSTHHSDPDNLMASGSIRNVGVDQVTETQCSDFLTKTSYPQ